MRSSRRSMAAILHFPCVRGAARVLDRATLRSRGAVTVSVLLMTMEEAIFHGKRRGLLQAL